MRGRRSRPPFMLVAVAVLAVPVSPVVADTAGKVVFTDGKMVIQCPNPVTGLGLPGSGINKGKKCTFALSSKNPHKKDLHTCNANAVSNTVKKGSAKPAMAQGTTFGNLINNCELTATGIIGPKTKTPLPPPLQGGGPWCFEFHGISGSGSLKIGPKAAPFKTINFDRVRMQVNAGKGLLTASAFKDDPGTAYPGQSGPLLGDITVGNDTHKIAQGVPNSSCITGNKNLKVSGTLLFLLLGNK